MTNANSLPEIGTLRYSIDDAVANYGVPRVLFAVLRAVLRPPPRRPRRPSDLMLSAHLRRDLGLPPIESIPHAWTRHL